MDSCLYLIECCLLPPAFFIATVLALEVIIAKRHGHPLAVGVMAGIIALSFLAAFITSQVLTESTADSVNPAIDWQKVTSLEKRASELQYLPESGLVAITEDGEVKITGIVPCCLRDGELAYSHPSQVEVTTTPYVELPSPSQPVRQQMSFNIFYSVEADAVAVSSFAVYENGEVWCTERFFQAGPSGSAAFGVVGFAVLYAAAMVFVSSFVVMLVFALIGLEVYRWGRRVKGRVTNSTTTS